MATANAYDAQGQHRGSVDLPAELFEAQVHEHLLYQSVKTYLANQRQGTHKVKTRAEVSGGGKKPWKQKGTGRARAGTNTSPLWPGGGRAFGPKPHDYDLGLPKKQRRAALLAGLSLRAREGCVHVIEEPSLQAPKTSAMKGVFDKLGLGEKRTLFVLGRHDENVFKSCRNLAGVRATLAHQLTPYHLMESDQLVLTQGALERLKEVFAS